MNTPRFSGPGSTATRRAFWDAVYDEVNAVQKVQGANIDIDVYPGGSVINADRAGALAGCALTQFDVSGVTPCTCMISGSDGYQFTGVFDGGYGPLGCTAPNQWFFTGLDPGFKFVNFIDCSSGSQSFNLDNHFELSLSGAIWTLNWYHLINGVHYPIFVATGTSPLINTVAGSCAGGANGAFGGIVTVSL